MGSDCIVKVVSSKYGTKVQKNMDDCRESISEIRIGSLEGGGLEMIRNKYQNL